MSRVDEFIALRRSEGAAEQTLRAYRSDLKHLLNHVTDMTDTELGAYFNKFQSEWSPKTTERRIGTAKKYCAFIGKAGVLVTYKAPKPAKSVPHPLPGLEKDLNAMLLASSHHHHTALVALCGLQGLRVSEALSIRPQDIDLGLMQLRVRGKGNKERKIPLGKRAWSYVMPAYTLALSLGTPIVPLEDRGARRAITRLGALAGVSRPVASHDLRMTCGTVLFNKTKNLRLVQDFLGHADPRTTSVYTGVAEAAIRDAIDTVWGE